MELPKMIFICVLMFLMSREALCQNIDRKEAVHNTIEYQGKHMQKRDHQGFIPQILKLRQPITLSKQLTQTRPKTNQEVRNQMIPRQTLHDIPQALQQRSQTIQQRPQSIQQRPINLRLNPATNLQRRVTNVTKYPVHNNNNTITQSVVPNNSPPEPPKDLEVKAAPPKQETVSAPLPNNPVIHILIPKETQADKSHKNADFFEDEDDASDNTLTNHSEYLNKMPVKDLNKHGSKVEYLDSMEVNKKPDKTLHNAEIRESSDHDDIKYDDENSTNKIKGRNKGKLNAMEDDRYAVDDEELFVQKSTKDDKITEKKAINKQPVPKTTTRTDKNKLKNSLKYSLTTNNYTGDNIISVKGRNGETRNKDLNNEIKQNSTTRHPIQTDKKDNVLIQNTYEEIYERSINSNPSVLYNKIPRNIQTPEYSAYKSQDISGENKFPIYSYTEDYGNQVPSASNIKCVCNINTNSYENDPNVFLNQEKPSVEYINENQIRSSLYDKPTNKDVADYYPKEPENYVNRIWRTWRNSEVRINNYRPINENMDCKEVPGEKVKYYIEEPLNAVLPITHGNLIGVNGCYKNQNIPVTCRYCPNYQCYY